ncbi:putative type VI secretion system effector [Janthinobacterium lividum]|uniref:Type VI secretion system effector n=1 Tax=Janthinobacterium lividum TaxID=29581 RepID=A0ABU0XP70_9BURK|nr:putative type VI secretion system effector [Janthinobacterium lividum]MDQ4624276.1 putative type VI secretion system effector [Janthinobacterium lividum]MDQ4674120.1 putative type VI secretion system effector [Janthinobacterium lividum]MDQ4684850.1 putative type VI secretion system effector [Janthinobacterium lividum]
MHEFSYKLVSGVVEELRTSDMHVNYLKSAESFKKMSGLTSIVQATTGESGAVQSAQAATSDGDPVTGFSMSVGGKWVSGSFWEVGFRAGDEVQVVGYQKGNDFIAVAVIDVKEKKIWMQPHSERGTTAKKYHLLKCCGYSFVGLCIFEILLGFFTGFPMWFVLICSAFINPIILFVTVGLSWKDFMSFAKEMNRVGKALVIAEPEKIDLFKSTRKSRKSGKPALPMGVYYL